MKKLQVHNTFGQVAITMAGFVFAVVLLESDGLANWANHLEIGSLRKVAVPVTGAIQRAIHPLGLYALRDSALDTLARAGWSDDAARLATASPKASPTPDTSTPKALRSLVILGDHAPLVSQTPRFTPLAPLAPVEPDKTRVVALAGDSMMAVGLSPELLRESAANPHLRLIKVFRSGTGLARPEVFNWQTEYPAMLGTEKPDVILVAIGANDGQGFVEDGKVLAFGSDDWKRVYQQRLANYLAMLRSGGAQIVWIGLPPMRSASYDEKIAVINQIAYSVVRESPGATWWNPASLVGDESGHFREYGVGVKGNQVKLRQGDGIHLSDDGAALLSVPLLKWLDPPATQIALAVPPPRPTTPPSPVAIPDPPAKSQTVTPAHPKKRKH